MKRIAAIPLFLLALSPVLAVPGWNCREGWELLLVWSAGLGAALLMRSWWRRIFALLALIQIVWHPAAISYASFAMIVLGLLAVDLFREVEPDRLMAAIRIGALSLAALMALQVIGLVPLYNKFGRPAGFFNPGSAGVYLALSLPAFQGWWGAAIPALVLLIIATASTTAAIAAGVGIAVYFTLRLRPGWKTVAAGLAVMGSMIFLIHMVDPVDRTLGDPRFRIWRHVVQTYDSAPWGRGLGSFQQIFPYFIAGDAELTKTVEIARVGNKPVLSTDVWWKSAHNEYLQAGFELGLPAMGFIFAFVAHLAMTAWRRRKTIGRAEAAAIAGLSAAAVSSAGWFTFHVAPLALMGLAWLGIRESALGRSP